MLGTNRPGAVVLPEAPQAASDHRPLPEARLDPDCLAVLADALDEVGVPTRTC